MAKHRCCWPVQEGNLVVVQMLIGAGADVLEITLLDGRSPLHFRGVPGQQFYQPRPACEPGHPG